MNPIRYANWNLVNELATKQVGHFSVYISNGLDYKSEEEDLLWKAVQEELTRMFGDKTPEFYDYISDVIHGGLLFFETEEQAVAFYKIFEHPLVDSSAIYATLICPVRGCLTENT